MVNKDLIRHILKEETRDTKSELIRQIKDEGLYSIAELVGGLDNLKRVFKDDPEMVERIENQKGLVKVSWTTDGDDPSIVLPFKIIGAGWNRWMTNSWPIVNISYNENTLTKDENHKFKDFLYDSFHDESSVRVLKLNSDEPRMHQNYVQLGEINGKTKEQNTTDLNRSYTLLDIQYIVEKLGDDNIIKEEVDNDKGIQKNLRTINILLKQVSWEGLCDIWVEYNPVDKDYEIRSKSIKRHFDHDEIVNELNFVEESIKAMGLRPYVFSPWHVDNCEDEVKFMNESINKSDEKRNKIIEKIMDDIIFPEYNHIICGYDVKNDNVFNEPVVNVTFIGGYGTKLWPVTQGIQKMYRDILDEIWDTIYDYINIPVGVTMETTTKCNEKENIYLRESVDKSEDKKLKLVTKMIHEFFDEVSFIEIKKYENKPMIIVYFDNDEKAGNEETYFAEQIQNKIYEYTGIKLIPYWHTIQYNTDADFRLDAIKLKYDGEGNVINESEENKKEKKFNRLIQNVEDYLNSNEYPSVKRFTVYYEDTHDDVIVNIFFDAEEAVKLGGGINSVIKKVGKQVMSDLEVFPLDFKYYTHFDKGINESEEKQPKYLNIIKNLIEPFKEEDCVCDIRVTFEDDMYVIYLVFGSEELNDLFFSFVGRARHGENLRNNVKNTITDYLPINNLYVGSISKPNCEWSPLNESENKKQSLLNTIEKEGLYNFIEMSGLDISQISSVLKNMDNPKEILKQYIRDFVLIHGYKWGDNSGILSGYEIQLSDNKYVDDIMVQDSDQIAVEILEFDIDEYGHTEQNDQYITTINNLTNEELLSIVAWMTETIKNGEWN